MIFYCGKCEKPVGDMNSSETPDGYLYSCPECDSPVAQVSHAELDSYREDLKEQEDAKGDPTAPGPTITNDEARYLLHLINKQLTKLEHAICQLINIKTKLGGYDD